MPIGLDPATIELARSGLSPAELAELDALLAEAIPEDLPGFFRVANPTFLHPEHLFRPGLTADGQRSPFSMGQVLEATVDSPQQAAFSTPPQVGKSQLLLCAHVRYAWRKPESTSAYTSYNDDIVHAQSDIARKMAERAGLHPGGTKSRLTLPNGSSILFASKGGPLEGKPVTGLASFDDPYKNRQEAESLVERQATKEWFFSTFLGRTHPSTSIIVIGHRWTVDDLIAEIDTKGWPWTNYPALWPDGRSIWEAFKPREWFAKRRDEVGPFKWLSEYQGNPTARGGRVYEGVHYYEELPKNLRVGIGVDFAYSEKTSADWSVAVVMGEHDAKWYVLEVLRKQEKPEVFAERLQKLHRKYPGAQWRWDASTTERGAAGIIRHFVKVPLQTVLAQGKPFERSQPSGAAWRRGDVLLPHPKKHPESDEWSPDYINELTSFAGGDDAQDDQVVATASAFALLPPNPIVRAPKYGSAEWIAQQEQQARAEAVERVRQRLNQRDLQARRSERWGR